jgi:hypothetical protein
VALVHFMRPSLRKGAHAALSSAAWQEIRVRSGRDDTSVWDWDFVPKHLFGVGILVPQQKCHPDRSVAQWRDLLLGLFPGDGHSVDAQGGGGNRTTKLQVVGDGDDVVEHLLEVAGDGDLLDGEG